MNPRPRRLFGEREQIQNHVERRMAAADDENALAGVTLPLLPPAHRECHTRCDRDVRARRPRRCRPSLTDSGAARCRWHRSPRAPRSSRRRRAESRTAARRAPSCAPCRSPCGRRPRRARRSGRAAESPDDSRAASRTRRPARCRSADVRGRATTIQPIRAAPWPRRRPCSATARTCARAPTRAPRRPASAPASSTMKGC